MCIRDRYRMNLLIFAVNSSEANFSKRSLPPSEKSVKDLRNGRWTKDERARFVEGLKRYGKNWKKVEVFVGTRSATQVRSHAQKYFLRLRQQNKIAPTQEGDLSVEHTFISAVQEKRTQLEAQPLQDQENSKREDLQSAFKPFDVKANPVKLPSLGVALRGDCKYLVESMRGYGCGSVEEIYGRYVKLSDWVDVTAKQIMGKAIA
eukprot:TRINITY_DN361_c0_g1_i10.p1 TRINITY_DN361_c0_g1~~TRINITY_DN361_c0_g1_i10.p1  ORF type:complete len:205 (+),score=40.23 TRINITY_DN361_c0_g1_i10:78-692(+)